ncbi:hypothetical protein F5X99DRAFT_269446 [Biscogniauxia marginata]|nr:hypothetical protein F5X99DRAFT_269446 [Biscogniauxia marginata]
MRLSSFALPSCPFVRLFRTVSTFVPLLCRALPSNFTSLKSSYHRKSFFPNPTLRSPAKINFFHLNPSHAYLALTRAYPSHRPTATSLSLGGGPSLWIRIQLQHHKGLLRHL